MRAALWPESGEEACYLQNFNLDFPTVAGVDRKLRAQIINESAKGLVVGTGQKWISNIDAGKQFVNLANKLGMDLKALGVELPEDDPDVVNNPNIANNSATDAYFKAMDKMAKDIQKTAPPKIGKSKIDMKTV